MFDMVHLSGFKKFGNYQENPTQLVSEHFFKQHIPNLLCSVVEVTTVDADGYIHFLKQQIQAHPGRRILILHLGVSGRKTYSLESCAYNQKDFSIPDNAGYQPRN